MLCTSPYTCLTLQRSPRSCPETSVPRHKHTTACAKSTCLACGSSCSYNPSRRESVCSPYSDSNPVWSNYSNSLFCRPRPETLRPDAVPCTARGCCKTTHVRPPEEARTVRLGVRVRSSPWQELPETRRCSKPWPRPGGSPCRRLLSSTTSPSRRCRKLSPSLRPIARRSTRYSPQKMPSRRRPMPPPRLHRDAHASRKALHAALVARGTTSPGPRMLEATGSARCRTCKR